MAQVGDSSAVGWLQTRSLFTFDAESRVRIASALERGATPLSQGGGPPASVFELNAAEAALARGFVRPTPPVFTPVSVQAPIRVAIQDSALALLKTNCSPFFEHGAKSAFEIQPWDVFLFAGDMSKFELLMPGLPVSELGSPSAMSDFVRDLEGRYTEAGFGPAFVETGGVALQGLLWYAKLTVMLQRSMDEVDQLELPNLPRKF